MLRTSQFPSNISRDLQLDDVMIVSNDMNNCINNKTYAYSITPESGNDSYQSAISEEEKKTEKDVINSVVEYLKPNLDIDPTLVRTTKKKVTSPFITTRQLQNVIKLDKINRNISESSDKHKHKHKKYILETSDDLNRSELLWSTQIEDVIKKWHNKCLEFACIHKTRYKHHRTIFYSLGIPAAIIPLTIAALNQYMEDCCKVLTVILLILTSILNTILGFLNPGKRSAAHLNFESAYNELAVEITSELVKPQRHRQAADVFIQRIMDRYNSLNNRAPAS